MLPLSIQVGVRAFRTRRPLRHILRRRLRIVHLHLTWLVFVLRLVAALQRQAASVQGSTCQYKSDGVLITITYFSTLRCSTSTL